MCQIQVWTSGIAGSRPSSAAMGSVFFRIDISLRDDSGEGNGNPLQYS